MKINLNIEGELLGINSKDGTILVRQEGKTIKYPIDTLSIIVVNNPKIV